MSKLALFLLFFMIVSNAGFIRPWENATWVATNPNIVVYGTDIWWNLPEFQESLDTLQLPESVPDEQIQKEILLAEQARNAAEGNFEGCSKVSELARLWASPPMSILAIIPTFKSAIDCYSYRDNWKAAVEHSLKALELSQIRAENSASAARASFEQLKFLGVCNLNYPARPHELCNNAATAFNSFDNHFSEGNFGGYVIFDDQKSYLNAELTNHKPDFSNAFVLFSLIWAENGTVPIFDKINKNCSSAILSTEGQYDFLHSINLEIKGILEEKLSILDKHEVNLIESSPSSYSAKNTGTISERFSLIEKKKSDVDFRYAQAGFQRENIYQEGYLATSIILFNSTYHSYEALVLESDELLENSEFTVKQQKIVAQDEIRLSSQEDNINPESIYLLRKANQSFEFAQVSETFGIMFQNYAEAAKFARMAREQRDPGSKILVQSSISSLKDLIALAKKDDLDVTTEEETLNLLGEVDSVLVDSYIQSAISSIISKARLYYGDDLESTRKSIIDRISAAGTPAQDLLSELDRLESGLVFGGVLKMPEAVGHLKKLKEDYSYLVGELDLYTADILGNSMAIRAFPLFSKISLDQPTEIRLDLVLFNPNEYGGKNVEIPVEVNPPIPFLYSDLISSKESVNDLYFKDGTMHLTLSEVSPFSSKRLSLEKQAVIARTISKKTSAVGTGGGLAHVTDVLEFELDYDVPHLELLQDNSSVLVDGASPHRLLQAGRHKLSTERVIDAYSESQSAIQSFPIGTKSKVEYLLEIIPKIDLDSVPVIVTSVNFSSISSFSMYPVTGEKMASPRKTSDTTYSTTIYSLKAGCLAKLRVSYVIEDPRTYANLQLALLQPLNLSEDGTELYSQARSLAAAGNYTDAIELLERVQVLQKEGEKEQKKVLKKIDELKRKFDFEYLELNNSLKYQDLGVPFIERLEARKKELEHISDKLGNLDAEDKLATLESIDFKWLDKEIQSFSKTSYKDYADLKERFHLAGESGIPKEFLSLESALNKLQAAPSAGYAVEVASYLLKAEEIVAKAESSMESEIQSRKQSLESFKSYLDPILEHYSRQAAEAKGTEYSSRFTESISNIEKLVKAADSSLDEGPLHFDSKFSLLNRSSEKISSILSQLRDESLSKIALLETLANKESLDTESRKEIAKKVGAIRSLHDSGDYVNSLRGSSKLSESIKGSSTDSPPGMLILGITALAILAVLAFYMLKPKKKPALKKVPKLADF